MDWSNDTVQRVIARYIELGRKPTMQDAENTFVRQVAEYYAANYTGTFFHMLQMRKHMHNFNTLPLVRIPGVISCMLHEYKQLPKPPTALPKPPTALRKGYPYECDTLPDLPAEIAAHKAQEALEVEAMIERIADYPLDPIGASHREYAKLGTIRPVAIKGHCSKCGKLTDVEYDTSLTPYCVDKTQCHS